MAVGQLPQARDAFVDGMVDLEVLTLQIEAALPAVVEPDEGDAGVVGRAFADQEGIARQAAGLVPAGPRWPASGSRPAWRRTTTPGRARTRPARSCPPEHTGHTVAIIKDESSGRLDRKRPFATHGQGRLPARAAVCRIPCRILCLVNVKRKSMPAGVGNARARRTPHALHPRC